MYSHCVLQSEWDYYKTEKEMLEDRIYNFASLSETEKGIYIKLKNDEYRQSNI